MVFASTLILAIILTALLMSASTILAKIDEETTDWWDEQ